MADWRKILVEGDAVADNLATNNLASTSSVRTFSLADGASLFAFKDDDANDLFSIVVTADNAATTSLSGGMQIVEDGASPANQGCLKLYASDSASNYACLMANGSATADQTITFPAAGPTGANQILESDASGNLSWIDTPSGSGGTIDGSGTGSEVAYWSDADTLTSSGDLIFDGTDLRVTNSVIASELDANTINAEVTGLSSDGDLGRGAELLKVATSFATSAARMYYINSSSSWTAADKDDEAAADGFLVVATGTNATDGMLVRGIMRLGSGGIGGTPAVGDKLYLSDNGTFTVDTSAYTTGDFIRAVGHYIATNTIYFNPSQEYIELA